MLFQSVMYLAYIYFSLKMRSKFHYINIFKRGGGHVEIDTDLPFKRCIGYYCKDVWTPPKRFLMLFSFFEAISLKQNLVLCVNYDDYLQVVGLFKCKQLGTIEGKVISSFVRFNCCFFLITGMVYACIDNRGLPGN